MKTIPIIMTTLLLTACASDKASQNLYSSHEVGQSIIIKSCTVITSRSVIIRDGNSGDQGESIGFIVGNIGARHHNNNRPLSGLLGGLVVGAIGRKVSDSLHERDGVEYTVILKNGEERQLVQDISEDESILVTGDSCRLQVTGDYNRVLPSNYYPNKVKRPTTVKFTD